MTIVVNLSAIHTLLPIDHAVEAFTALQSTYSSNGCCSCCPSFFNHWTLKQIMNLKLKWNQSSLIDPYKLGIINTDQFIDGMLEALPFMRGITIPASEKTRLLEDKLAPYTLKNVREVSEITNEMAARALLEEAWNSIIAFQNEDRRKIQMLLESGESICFISNSNELHIMKILDILREEFPAAGWYDEIDLSVKQDGVAIKLAPNSSLYVSYRFNAFKTLTDKTRIPNTTPTLLPTLLRTLLEREGDSERVRVVSQYAKDLDEAKKLGVSEENIVPADKFFIAIPASKFR